MPKVFPGFPISVHYNVTHQQPSQWNFWGKKIRRILEIMEYESQPRFQYARQLSELQLCSVVKGQGLGIKWKNWRMWNDGLWPKSCDNVLRKGANDLLFKQLHVLDIIGSRLISWLRSNPLFRQNKFLRTKIKELKHIAKKTSKIGVAFK